MPVNVPPLPFLRRRIRRAAPVPQPVALTLTGAQYDDSVPEVFLMFDRDIDIAGIVGSAILVDDGNMNFARYNGTGGAILVAPNIVRVALVQYDAFTDPAVILNASAGSGIVAVDDGGTWAGVSGLDLPFPPP